MKNHPNSRRMLLTVASLAGLAASCVIKPFAEGKNFYGVLHRQEAQLKATTQGADSLALGRLLKNDGLILRTYRDFEDQTAHDNLLRFQQGCYLLRLENTEDTVGVARANGKPPKDFVTTTVSYASDTLLPPFSDKLSYLLFLDDHRVMYHSPYRKNYLKTGTFGKVNTQGNQADDTPGYARRTENFFKLGTRYEFNSCRRGYYKLRGNQLLVCLELNVFKKKSPYPAELLLLRFTALPNPMSGKIETLVFNFAWYGKDSVNIPDTFQAFEKPIPQPARRQFRLPAATPPTAPRSDKAYLLEKPQLSRAEVDTVKDDPSQLHFSFLKTPFTLLLVDSLKQIHLVDSISTESNGTRHYHCKLRHQRPGTPRPGTRVAERTGAIFTY